MHVIKNGFYVQLLLDCRGVASHSRLVYLTTQCFPSMLFLPIPWSKAINHACRRRLRSCLFLCET